jgi:hypothetical protein
MDDPILPRESLLACSLSRRVLSSPSRLSGPDKKGYSLAMPTAMTEDRRAVAATLALVR